MSKRRFDLLTDAQWPLLEPMLPEPKRRWIIERTNAWFGQFRRLLVRHEHLLATYRAFVLPRLPLDYTQAVLMKQPLDIKGYLR